MNHHLKRTLLQLTSEKKAKFLDKLFESLLNDSKEEECKRFIVYESIN